MSFCKNILLLLILTLVNTSILGQQRIFKTNNGTIYFRSDAPLELITASSKKLEGVMNPDDLTFVFQVSIKTFEGFNNGLQQVHFYENYMETEKYPTAIFSGKIIEQIDFKTPGVYNVRAKGQLTIHGHSKERIIRIQLTYNGTEIKANSTFFVPLVDHQIEVPKLVNQKIAREIEVSVKATLIATVKS